MKSTVDQRRLLSTESYRRAKGVKVKHFFKPGDLTKWCSKCQQYLAVSEFAPNKGRGSKLRVYCHGCSSTHGHEAMIKKTYGITADDYYRMLEGQGGACAICFTLPRKKRLAVDHNHKTGEVRGLLCTMCNHRVLGGAKDDASILRRAADYLDNPPSRQYI